MLYPVAFAGGFAVCWFFKDWILVKVSGAETFIRSLEDKASALKAKVRNAL